MVAIATFAGEPNNLQKRLAASALMGEIHQNGDGRATYIQSLGGLGSVSSGDTARTQPANQTTIPKQTGIAILDGGRVYLDRSAGLATYRTNNDRDYYLGVAVGDTASDAAFVTVNQNVEPRYEISLGGGPTISQDAWTPQRTNGLGVTLLPGGGAQFAFHAANEAAQAALFSERTVALGSRGIAEFRAGWFNQGNNAALNVNFGLANGSHATDFQSVTQQVTFRLKGNSLHLFAESKDGTTPVAAIDTGVTLTAGQWDEYWIDYRDPTDVQLYRNGVLLLPNSVFTLAAATGPIFPIVCMTKTTDDTVADFRIMRCCLRTAEQGATT